MALGENVTLEQVFDEIERCKNLVIDRGGAKIVTPKVTNQILNEGNYKGDITILGDSDLVASNIKNGVDIFGVVGNLKVIDDLPIWVTNNTIALSAPGYPLKVYSYGKCYVDARNELFTLGGRNDNDSWYDNLYIFRINTNVWESGAAAPNSIIKPMMVDFKGLVYSLGGGGPYGSYVYDQVKNYNMCYNPASNTWTSKASLPTPRYSAAACVVGDLIYIQGGKKSALGSTDFDVEDIFYNTATNTYTTIPKYVGKESTGYGSSKSIFYNNSIYIINTYDFKAFNTVTQTWTAKTPCPGYAIRLLGIRGNKIYASTSYSGEKVYEYNTSNDTWRLTSTKINSVSFLSKQDWLYQLGGYDQYKDSSIMFKLVK